MEITASVTYAAEVNMKLTSEEAMVLKAMVQNGPRSEGDIATKLREAIWKALDNQGVSVI